MKRAMLVVLSLAAATVARADQPIMNMMPRWSGGWGFQFIEEYRYNSELLLGDDEVGDGLSEEVHILNLEAVYTWQRWIRLTAKMPYILHAEREVPDGGGGVEKQKDNGLGDLTLALPLKQYFNLDGRSGSWTAAPQLRVPLAGDDDYEIGDNEWGGGLFLGYETETADWFIGTGVSAWVFDGDEPFEMGASLDFGRNVFAFGSSGQITWETDYKWEDDGSTRLKSGPAIYWKFTDTVHGRLEWKHDFYDYRGVLDHGNGDTVKVGIGFVF
ncbi:MAG: hypothetical protein ACPGIA_11170 [Luteolibacter sp.]